jgi:CDP-diacylglycerol pyrophosphatase
MPVSCLTKLGRSLPAAVLVAALWGSSTAHADSDALWKIVSGQCVPNEEQHDNPAPCALVDLSLGDEHGYAVLKDIKGPRQFLVIATSPISGIESPEILAPDATNYFAAAWRSRSFLDERTGFQVPRDWVSLAINSAVARTQDQLHIHIDCVRADVRAAVITHLAEIGSSWAPFPVPLAGNSYSAIEVAGENLDNVNPFRLLADGLPNARDDMGRQTLVVLGTVGASGQPGFVILADQVYPEAGDVGAGEDLQDHTSCPVSK